MTEKRRMDVNPLACTYPLLHPLWYRLQSVSQYLQQTNHKSKWFPQVNNHKLHTSLWTFSKLLRRWYSLCQHKLFLHSSLFVAGSASCEIICTMVQTWVLKKTKKVAASCQMNKNAQATATRVQHLHRWGESLKSLHILAKAFHRHNWVYFLSKPPLSSKAAKCHPTCFSARYKSPLLDKGERIPPGCV